MSLHTIRKQGKNVCIVNKNTRRTRSVRPTRRHSARNGRALTPYPPSAASREAGAMRGAAPKSNGAPGVCALPNPPTPKPLNLSTIQPVPHLSFPIWYNTHCQNGNVTGLIAPQQEPLRGGRQDSDFHAKTRLQRFRFLYKHGRMQQDRK